MSCSGPAPCLSAVSSRDVDRVLRVVAGSRARRSRRPRTAPPPRRRGCGRCRAASGRSPTPSAAAPGPRRSAGTRPGGPGSPPGCPPGGTCRSAAPAGGRTACSRSAAKPTLSPSKMHASPKYSFCTHAASRTLTVNQPSVAATRPYSGLFHLRLVHSTRLVLIRNARESIDEAPWTVVRRPCVLALPSSAHAASFRRRSSARRSRPAANPYGVAAADFNGDGLVDVAAVNGNSSRRRTTSRSTCARPAAASSRRPDRPFGAVGRSELRRDRRTSTATAEPDLAVAKFGGSVVDRPRAAIPATTGFAGGNARRHRCRAGARSERRLQRRRRARPRRSASGTAPSVRVFTRHGQRLRPGGELHHRHEPAPDRRSATSTATAAPTSPSRTRAATASRSCCATGSGTAFASEGARSPSAPSRRTSPPADFNARRPHRRRRRQLRPTTPSSCCCATPRTTASRRRHRSPSPIDPIGLTAADFDRNGTPDVAVASNAGGAVTVLSAADGARARRSPLAHAYDLAAADFNARRRPDLAVTSTRPTRRHASDASSC